MAKITVAIPTHEMQNGDIFLKRSLNYLRAQKFKDFDVVITDNSENDVVKDIVKLADDLKIKYYRNPRKGMAQNTNEAIKRSTGDLIKILYMDDYLAHENSLKLIVEAFRGHWLVTGCNHVKEKEVFNEHLARYNHNIHLGDNTIGSPSVLTIKNSKPLLFDEEMTWLLDCDYYKRLFNKFGMPVIIDDINVTIGLGKHQVTNILGDDIKNWEANYTKGKKYD